MELLFGLILAATASECPPREEILATGQQFLLEGDLKSSKENVIQAEKSFSCDTLVTPQEFGKFMLLKGSHFYFEGRPQKSSQYFRIASQLNVWDPIYGPQLHQHFIEATNSSVGTIQLTVDIPRKYMLYIDGSPSKSPIQLEINHHLIQVTDDQHELHYTKYSYIQSDHHISISQRPGRKKAFLLTAMGTAGLSISTVSLAHQQNKEMTKSTTLEELDKHYQRQQIFTSIGWTSLGITILSGAFYLFW